MNIQSLSYDDNTMENNERTDFESSDCKIPVGCPLLHCVANCPIKTECNIIAEMRSSSNKCCEKFFKHFGHHFMEPHKKTVPLCAKKVQNPAMHTYCPYQHDAGFYRGFPQSCLQCPYMP